MSVATSLTRNTIFIEIFGKRHQALVDSGASISCLSKSLYARLVARHQINISSSKLSNVVGVGGERHTVLGDVKLKLNISGLQIDQTFAVIDSLHHDIILGLDFMTSNHVKIDFQQRCLSVGDDTVVVALACDSKLGYARPVKRFTISAQSETVVPVKVSGGYKNETVLLEPSEDLHALMLAGARCLVTTKGHKAALTIMNPTEKDITLSPTTVVANVNLVDDKEVHVLGNGSDCSANVSSIRTDKIDCTKGCEEKDFLFDVCNGNLSVSEKQRLKEFLRQNNDVFSNSLSSIGKTDVFSHKIETIPGATPVHLPPHRTDPVKKKEIERQTAEMKEAGLIVQSDSVWHSPVVLVKKKDNSWRFAIDYRKLNSITIPISHPLPRIEDVFDALGESHAKVFSTLDLNSAYFQIALDPETRHKASFITHEGVFEFLRMPFGLRNAPMSFQLLMSVVLRGLNWKFVLCYIDDILVFSPDFETHIKHLGEVFQRLRDAKLTLKPSKCKFCVDKIMFLGHIISEKGVQVDPSKTDKVQNFPVPKTQKELRSFLGLCNYYRRFVLNYAKICVPLNKLLKKDVKRTFQGKDWTNDCQTAFETLKKALVSPPILKFPDMNKEFILTTDASGSAIGYILGQLDETGKECVIAYGGRALRPEEMKWSVTDLECLAVICGVEAYKPYLTSGKITVYTDHSSLNYLMNKKEPTGRLYRWALKLQSYNLEIKHRKGLLNQNADALSRLDYTRLETTEGEAKPSLTSVNQLDCSNSVENKGLVRSDMSCSTQCSSVENCATIAESSCSKPSHTQLSLNTPVDTEQNSPPVSQTFNDDCKLNSDIHYAEPIEDVEVQFDYSDPPVISVVTDDDIAAMQRECNFCKDFINALENGVYPADTSKARSIAAQCENQYVMLNSVLYHVFTPRVKNAKVQIDPDRMLLQLVVPTKLRKSILQNYHDCLAGGGHFGIKKTFASIKEKYFWPKMFQDINDYVKSCDVCQRTKVNRRQNRVPLHPLPVEGRFSRIHIDILCSLPKTKEGYQYILLIVDSFTKWTECFPLRTQEAKEIADILYSEFITRYGAPRSIVSDRGRNFMSKLVSALCELFEIKRHHTSSYHPQSNATVERANSTLLQTLRAFVRKDQMNWPKLIPSIMMAFRSSPNTETTGFSPYEMVFGDVMNLPIDTTLIPKATLPQSVKQYFNELTSRIKVVSEIARFNQEHSQAKAKDRHDIRAKTPPFKIGDKVLLKQDMIPAGQCQKLTAKRDGPYVIHELGPSYTYKIRHLESGKIHKTLVNAARLTHYIQRQNEAVDDDVNNNEDNGENDPNENPTLRLNNNLLPDPNPEPPDHPLQDSENGQTDPPKVSDSDNENTPVDAQSAPSRDMSSVRIIQASRKGGVQRFRVEYNDGFREWKYEKEIPKDVVETYLQKYNRMGKKRRRRKPKRPKFFTRSSA